MNLAIDIGNSSVKAALFEGTTLHSDYQIKGLLEAELNILIDRYHVKNAIISSVKGNNKTILAFLKQHCQHAIELAHDIELPIRILYDTPHTLGRDRIAAAVGAKMCIPEKNILVIDIGTCITYDLVTADGIFQGGNIAPGIQMRLDAMQTFTACLPQLQAATPKDLLGANTSEAMLSGAYWGIVFEIEGLLNKLKNSYPQLSIILTGGGASFFEQQFEQDVVIDKYLVLRGLNAILNYQQTI